MKLLLATANAHKIDEIRGLLAAVAGLKICSLADFPGIEMPEETGATMAENARLKALHCAAATGLPSLADDSGIEVNALGGEPGVRSARWHEGSDADRTAALMQRLQNVPALARGARYRCAICLAWPSSKGGGVEAGFDLRETEATCEGAMAEALSGANGFGYDPAFLITTATGAPAQWQGRTMAEAPPQLKAQVSHRGRAIALLLPSLARLAMAGDAA